MDNWSRIGPSEHLKLGHNFHYHLSVCVCGDNGFRVPTFMYYHLNTMDETNEEIYTS